MERIGKYEILEKIGRGGMGTVYLGMDSVIGRKVAIKIIREDCLRDSDIKERFYREARSVGRLSHENIMTIFDVGEDQDRPYIVMEYLEGEDLRSTLRQKIQYDAQEKLDIGIKICRGLHYAHEHGVIHRDIKPDNIRVMPGGRLKIMDFGIARIQDDTHIQTITVTGSQLGTPRYMSPEQIRGEKLDRRSDIFSFGVLFYELLSGAPPFAGDNVTTLIYKILNVEPEPVEFEPESLSSELSPIVSKCLAKDRDERYNDVGELLADLDIVMHGTDRGGMTRTVGLSTTRSKSFSTADETRFMRRADPPETLDAPGKENSLETRYAADARDVHEKTAVPDKIPSAAPAKKRSIGLTAAIAAVVIFAVSAGIWVVFDPFSGNDPDTGQVQNTQQQDPLAENAQGATDQVGETETNSGDLADDANPESEEPELNIAMGSEVAPPESESDLPERQDKPVTEEVNNAQVEDEQNNEQIPPTDVTPVDNAIVEDAPTGQGRQNADNVEADGAEDIASQQLVQEQQSDIVQAEADDERNKMFSVKTAVISDMLPHQSYLDALEMEGLAEAAYERNEFENSANLFRDAGSAYLNVQTVWNALNSAMGEFVGQMERGFNAKDLAKLGELHTYYGSNYYKNLFSASVKLSSTTRVSEFEVVADGASAVVSSTLVMTDNKNQERKFERSEQWSLREVNGRWRLVEVENY